MNYEKKYKEALERAEILIETLESTHIKGFIYNIFPELKETDDERIRKTLIGWVNIEPQESFGDGFTKEEIIAWLEKQGRPTR